MEQVLPDSEYTMLLLTENYVRKQLFATVKPLQTPEEKYTDPIFHSSKTPNEEAYWLNHEKNVIDEYVLNHNYNKGNYYNYIYYL